MATVRGLLVALGMAFVAAGCGGDISHAVGGDGGGLDAPVVDAPGAPDGPVGCGLRTCLSAGATCGPIGDGCGSVLQCGDCVPPTTCGGGGVPSQCGGTTGCVPKTCLELGVTCGPMGDGCGSLIAGGCGDCAAPDTCGGGGLHGQCGTPPVQPDGGPPACTPLTCAQLGVACGPAGDGCGGLIAGGCGGCGAPDTCGGGGVPGHCGRPATACTPKTCAQLGFDCGPAGDGCGGLVAGGCGTCGGTNICGGGGVPGRCGNSVASDGGVCVNLCTQQVQCPSGTTSVSGTVYAPNGKEPLFNALVYVPNAPLADFPPGVACDRCGAAVSGAPLVQTTTGPDGTFTLGDMPVGASIPLVIQLGRWRRVVTLPNVPQCVDTALAPDVTRLPRNQGEGHIPLTAMVTGNVDQLECVLRKIGLDEGEFTLPSGTGRIHMYTENGVAHMQNGANIPAASTLWGATPRLDDYDIVAFACEGGEHRKSAAAQQRVRAYADKGGRVFATHYSYVWLYENDPWGCYDAGGGNTCTTAGHTTALWDPLQGQDNTLTFNVDTSFPKGASFSQWLDVVSASRGAGTNQVDISVWRHDADLVYAPTQRWLYGTDPRAAGDPTIPASMVEHLTFNTPVGTPADQQCGRVLFSDFHVTNATNLGGSRLFQQCDQTADLTGQEKILEFMLFDLASCVTADVPTCTPRTCQQLGLTCGPAGDGCGNLIPGGCGTCTPPAVCGGAGVPGQCGQVSCAPLTCGQLGLACGPAGDGCGQIIDCGPCTAPATCGGGGVPGQCGSTGSCGPWTCADFGFTCGPAGDGCGHVLDCGPCTPPDTCGGGGVQGRCGHQNCTGLTCAAAGAECGWIGDGCGGQIDCGPCTPPQTCGGGGTPNVCGTIG
ncbi:MAG TPA: hypothetical protein VGQ83_01015 [Polyangia bacterium]